MLKFKVVWKSCWERLLAFSDASAVQSLLTSHESSLLIFVLQPKPWLSEISVRGWLWSLHHKELGCGDSSCPVPEFPSEWDLLLPVRAALFASACFAADNHQIRMKLELLGRTVASRESLERKESKTKVQRCFWLLLTVAFSPSRTCCGGLAGSVFLNSAFLRSDLPLDGTHIFCSLVLRWKRRNHRALWGTCDTFNFCFSSVWVLWKTNNLLAKFSLGAGSVNSELFYHLISERKSRCAQLQFTEWSKGNGSYSCARARGRL